MKALLIGPIAAFLLFSGCDQPASSELAPAAEPVTADADLVVFGNPPAVTGAATTAENEARIAADMAVLHGYDALEFGATADTERSRTNYAAMIRSDAPLADKDAAVAALLDEHAAPERFVLRQSVAAPMLARHLAAGSTDLGAIGRYTRALVADRNPSADLLAPALAELRGAWTDAEIAAAARSTHAAASAWLADNCAECQSKARDLARSSGAEPGHDAKAAGIAAALDELGALGA